MSVEVNRNGTNKVTNEVKTEAIKVEVTQEIGGKKFGFYRKTEQKIGYTEAELNDQSGYFANKQTGEMPEMAALAKDAKAEVGAYKESTTWGFYKGDWRVGVEAEVGVAAPSLDLLKHFNKPKFSKDEVSGKIWSPFNNFDIKIHVGKRQK